MKTPIYEKVFCKSVEVLSIVEGLKEARAGEQPVYFELDLLPQELIPKFLLGLEESLKLLNLHPFLPYPIYLVGSYQGKTGVFTKYDRLDQLPPFFNPKLKRLGSKESAILAKTKTYVQKIKNAPLKTRMEDLEARTDMMREFKRITEEATYLENLLKELQRS